MKKLLIYSPYWHVKGGGERYLALLGECLKERFEVVLAPMTASDKQDLGRFLNVDLKGISVLERKPSKMKMLSFDTAVWMSDGSIPFIPLANKVLLIQAPFLGQDVSEWKNRIKLLGLKLICYSEFVRDLLKVRYGVKAKVVYPPIRIEDFNSSKKDKLILTVGRFSSRSQHKRQDILVKVFKEMVDNGLKGWRLMISGITEDDESQRAAMALRVLAKGYPIAIRENLSRERLINLFKQAAIYWHAAGFGENLERYPQKAEHFGISTVEAMAAAAVPVVFAAGGQLEILENGESGILWKTTTELKEKTLLLINNQGERTTLAKKAKQRSLFFSDDRFRREIRELLIGA